jgi:hypothetical protein
VCVLRSRVDVSATGRLLVQRSRTECGVSECDLETSSMRRPKSEQGCRAMKKCNRVNMELEHLYSIQVFIKDTLYYHSVKVIKTIKSWDLSSSSLVYYPDQQMHNIHTYIYKISLKYILTIFYISWVLLHVSMHCIIFRESYPWSLLKL